MIRPFLAIGLAGYAHGGWKAKRPLEVIGAQMNVACAVASEAGT